jgi:hypothetical protein
MWRRGAMIKQFMDEMNTDEPRANQYLAAGHWDYQVIPFVLTSVLTRHYSWPKKTTSPRTTR